MQERWSFRRSYRIADGVDFVFLDVSLYTAKLDSLVQILHIVWTVPAQLCVFLPFLHIPDYRSLVFAEMFSLQFTVTDECYLLPDTTNLTAVRTEINIINFLFMCGKIVDAVEVWKGEDPEMSVISTGS